MKDIYIFLQNFREKGSQCEGDVVIKFLQGFWSVKNLFEFLSLNISFV